MQGIIGISITQLVVEDARNIEGKQNKCLFLDRICIMTYEFLILYFLPIQNNICIGRLVGKKPVLDLKTIVKFILNKVCQMNKNG